MSCVLSCIFNVLQCIAKYCVLFYVCSYENTTCTCDSAFRNGKGKILGTYTVVEATSYKSP